MIPLIDYLLEMVELDESFKAYLRSTTARESAEIQVKDTLRDTLCISGTDSVYYTVHIK